MLSKNEIYATFMQLKKVLYIEKDKDGNIIYPTDKDALKLYSEILQSKVKEDNSQFYHKNSRCWYQKLSKKVIDSETGETHELEYFEDITKIKEEERMLKIDALTNLINDRNESDKMINEYINEAIQRKEEFSIIMADLDDFKSVNDTYGHECGDVVLGSIGELLLHNTRQSEDKFDYGDNDVVTRVGGDEFLLLLKNISLEDTKLKIGKLREAVTGLDVVYRNEPVAVGMSFGYYHVGKNDIKSNNDIEKMRQTISKKADDYLYRNKNKRKATYLNLKNLNTMKKGMK